MKDYIDRSDLLKELERFPHLKTAESVVRSMPKADVVDVVRCRDCLYCSHVSDPIVDAVLEFCEYGLKPVAIEPAHFCSYGERKERK